MKMEVTSTQDNDIFVNRINMFKAYNKYDKIYFIFTIIVIKNYLWK